MWRYGGALQDVLVVSGEDVRIQDLNIEAAWNQDPGELALDIFVDVLDLAAQAGEDLMVSAIIQDPEGALVHTKYSRLIEQVDYLDLRHNQQIYLSASIARPLLWSPENPTLYHVLVTLETPAGYIYDAVATEFGVRQPATRTFEILNVHQKIWIEAHGHGSDTFLITNHFDYLSLTEFEPRWELFENGCSIATGRLAPLAIGPREQGMLTLSPFDVSPYGSHEVVLKISFHIIKPTTWAARGQCVAQSQFNLASNCSASSPWLMVQSLCA